MNKFQSAIAAIALCLISSVSFGQMTGVQTIPGSFPTIEAAVTALNASGVGAGGATINVAAGYTETPSTSLVLTIATNAPSAANPLVIQKSGVGANPMITAPTTGTTINLDGIFILNGVDYVTINGIDLQENAANVTTTTQMEFGYALLKTSTTNGAAYNTIKNCTITLNKSNVASVGIYVGNHTTAATTALVLTSFSGSSSYNKFYNNSILNCYVGISITGFGVAAPYDLYDQGNEIGVDGVSTRRSQVQNYGGGAATANGIFAINQNGIKIFNTYINNAGGAPSTGTLNGISLGTGTNSNVDIFNDTITVSSASIAGSTLMGINSLMGGTGAGSVVNIFNNVVDGCTYGTNTSGEFRGISTTATASYTNIHDNKVTNNTIPGTGQFSGIYYGGSSVNICLLVNLNNNTISGNTHTGAAGQFNCIYASSSCVNMNCYNNIMSNNSNATSSTATYGYFNFAFALNENIYNNTVSNLVGGTNITSALFISSGSGPTNKEVYGNTINGISANASGSTVEAITIGYGTIVNVYKNNIYDLTNSGATGGATGVCGIDINANVNTQVSVYNNFISDLKAPTMSSVTALTGIWLNGTATSALSAYNNTVYMNASSSGANFGTLALNCGASPQTIDLRNNILVNTSTATGTGLTRALGRSSTVLTTYAGTSGYNCLYAGVPSATNLIFWDGVNSCQSLQEFKNLVGPRDQSSFTTFPPFLNILTPPFDLHLQTAAATQCEGGGTTAPGVTTDYDGTVRNVSTPDVGADEISGITIDIASPNIQYVLLGNSGVAATRVLTNFATITDPSGINTTIGTRPRIYYKRTANANTYNSNTNATDGWKYVEASNTSSPFNFTVDYSLLFGGGVVAGDIIQYFVVAQDLNGTPIFGMNNGGLTGQPSSVNLAAANFPLLNTINQYTIVNASFSGTINVGPTELITSLTNAGGIFQGINASALSGNLIINITGDLTAETGTFALNQWSEEGVGGYTVTIQPSAATVRNIYGTNAAAALIRFDGADRVNIDGRFASAGSYLMFRNISNAAPTIGFVNDAQNNTVQYSIIESGNTSTSTTLGGALFIGTTTGPNGNDNITISNCEIRDRSDVAGTPAIGIQCVGTNTGPLAQYNNNCIFTNNNIHDWFLLNSTSQFGMNVGAGNTGFTITGNSFYQTAVRTNTVSGAVTRGINISFSSAVNSNGGYIISNNFIGGTAPGATGGDMTYTVSGVNVSQTFGAISVTSGLIPNSIQGNIIRKIDFTTNTASSAVTAWFGINLGQGIHNVGNTTGNMIGDGATNSSLKITINAGGAFNSFLAGILAATTNGSYNIQNNTIAGITVAGSTSAGGIIPQWIQVQGTPSTATTISGNTIGSTTTANSIQNNATAAACIQFAIRFLTNTGGGATITNNTIQNITDNSASASSQDYGILLISTVGQTGTLNVNGNTIRDYAMSGSSASPVFGLLGISTQGYGGTTHTFNNNIIAGLNCANAGVAQNYAVGIQAQGNSFGATMNQNRIFDMRNANTGSTPGIVGVYLSTGLNWYISNNMVSISNGANTNLVDMSGIVEFMPLNSTIKLFYNSVYVGGSTSTGTLNTACYVRNGAGNTTVKDNLFYNKRTGGTGFHVAIAAGSTNWNGANVNYNAYIVADTTKVGYFVASAYNMSGWRSNTAADANTIWSTSTAVTSGALFVNANTGNLHINTSTYPEALGTPIAGLTVDYDNNPRSATTPTIGADELACSAIVFSVSAQTNNTCNGGSTGSATVAGTGGNGITYSWAPSGGTAATATGLAAGTYTCTVSNICGNVGTVVVTITQPAQLVITPTLSNVTCNGNANGIATAVVTGGTGAYTYAWTPSGGTAATATNLAPGTYTCTVIDANSCSTSQTFNITEPSLLTSTSTATSIACNGGNATVTVVGTGGTSPYTGTGTFTVTAGTYTYTVTDANGCTSNSTLTITQPTAVVATSSATSILCNSGTSTVTVNATGGTGAYTGTGTFTVTAGTYNYTVTDANGCSNTTTVVLTEPTVLAASSTSSAITCNGGNSTVTVVGTGGTAPYTGTGTFTVTAGTYNYTVTDANGCSNTTTITVTEPSAVSATATATAIACHGGNATVTVSATGGTGVYTGTGTFTVTAGTYNYTVTDANGCSNTAAITVTEPATLSASIITVTNPTTCSGSDGAIDLSVNGGTAAYTFVWSNSASTEDLTGLTAGAYTVTVTDANGCTATTSANLNDPNAPVVTLVLTIDTACQTTTAPFVLAGGSPAGGNYSGPGVSAGSFDPMAASLGFNLISYTYTDVNGCTGSIQDSIYVDVCTNVNAAVTLNNFVLFPNPNNGTFMIQLNTVESADVVIYDALGQLVSKQKVQPKVQQQLTIASSGVYLITVITADGKRTSERVIVSK